MIDTNCAFCDKKLIVFPSRFKKSKTLFCNKSCHRKYKNNIDNPSLKRDISGSKNPMFGKHPKAWNKGLIGSQSHNWKGGIHKRKDGYFRIRIGKKRELLHRHLLKGKLEEGNVVHHKDGNPSNNNLNNLVVLSSQSLHAKIHAITRNTK